MERVHVNEICISDVCPFSVLCKSVIHGQKWELYLAQRKMVEAAEDQQSQFQNTSAEVPQDNVIES